MGGVREEREGRAMAQTLRFILPDQDELISSFIELINVGLEAERVHLWPSSTVSYTSAFKMDSGTLPQKINCTWSCC